MLRIKVGTRGSKLALKQTNLVIEKIKNLEHDAEFEIKIIKTKGDRILNSPLSKIGGKGLFTKEIEEEMLRGEIDMAVHSLKDLPTQLPDGLKIGAVLEREDPRDVLISFKFNSLEEFPSGSKIGTSSLRRKAQILNKRKDLELIDIRGNVDTRVRKAKEGIVDGVVMAYAGLRRMNLTDSIKYVFSTDEFLPAPGQGVIIVETREECFFQEILNKLDNEETKKVIKAERSFLETIEGGCQVPAGAYAKIMEAGKINLTGFVSDLNGERVIKKSMESEDPVILGRKLGEEFLKLGAGEIIEEARKQIAGKQT